MLCFHAELVADVLRHGGLLDKQSNPGAATPQGLHNLYKSRAAVTANPFLLRQANCKHRLTTDTVVSQRVYTPPPIGNFGFNSIQANKCGYEMLSFAPKTTMLQSTTHMNEGAIMGGPFRIPASTSASHTSALRVINNGNAKFSSEFNPSVGFTLNSLNFRK